MSFIVLTTEHVASDNHTARAVVSSRSHVGFYLQRSWSAIFILIFLFFFRSLKCRTTLRC